MILRRVIEHVRKQEWTAIWIDLAIVVVGVFIGIQVSNWNAERSERVLEARYLGSLAEDIRSDIREIDTTIEVSLWRMSVLEELAFKASGEPVPAGFRIGDVAVPANAVPPYTDTENKAVGLALVYMRTLDGNRSTYETLINTGGIGLLRDPTLLRQVQEYYAAVEEIQDTEKNLVHDKNRTVDAAHDAGFSPMDSRNVAELRAIFAGNPRLTATARTLWGGSNYHVTILKGLRRQSEALAERIEKQQRP